MSEFTREILDSAAEPDWLISALPRIERLTRRQLSLLGYLASGMDNKTIAGAMHCSDRTVKLHATEVVRRLGVSSRLQAALVGHHVLLSRTINASCSPFGNDSGELAA